MYRYLPGLLLLAHVLVAAAADDLENWTQVLVTQSRQGEPLPVLSDYGAEISLEDAYSMQRALVDALLQVPPKDSIGGFKASLTDALSQISYKIDTPVSGVLFKRKALAPGAEINLADYKAPTLEFELGFILDHAVTSVIANVEQLKPMIRRVVPVIDFSDFRYEHLAGLRGPELVAGNVAASGYIVGNPLASKNDETVNGVFVELVRNGEVVDRGKATNVMGDQFKALLWLVNNLIRHGYRIEAGQLLLTGAMGASNIARPGEYLVRYRDLEDIPFLITYRKTASTASKLRR